MVTGGSMYGTTAEYKTAEVITLGHWMRLVMYLIYPILFII